jgi:hypothetical protein
MSITQKRYGRRRYEEIDEHQRDEPDDQAEPDNPSRMGERAKDRQRPVSTTLPKLEFS